MQLRLSLQYTTNALDTIQLKKYLPPTTVRRWVLKALQIDAHQLDTVALTIRWVDEAEGRELNRNYRGVLPNGADKDYPTNVLTFSYGFENTVDQKNNMSADIVLCWPVLLAEAHAQSKSIRHHAAHLIIHGVLHALGFDHELEEEAKEMEGIETKLLAELSIANPYIDHA
jgi:probable rRNA maturation factor